MTRLLAIARWGAVAILVPFGLAFGDEKLNGLKPFLKQHCFECHGPEKQKNDIRFDTLGIDLSDKRTLEVWQEVLDQLNLGEMPPKKKPQPSRQDVDKVVDALTARLKIA